MSSPQQFPTSHQTYQAAKTIARALGNTKYAVVGGGACAVLGSNRQTMDVDFVVPKGETKAARALLKQDEAHFEVEKRTQHTIFKNTPAIEVEILTPPALFKEEFTDSTPTHEVDGIKVLKPTLLLNAKCASILSRPNDDKRLSDAKDIRFLLHWCATHGMHPTTAEVPHATKEFVTDFIRVYGSRALWTAAGYDVETGNYEMNPRSCNPGILTPSEEGA